MINERQARIILDILDISISAKGAMETYPDDMIYMITKLMEIAVDFKPLISRGKISMNIQTLIDREREKDI